MNSDVTVKDVGLSGRSCPLLYVLLYIIYVYTFCLYCTLFFLVNLFKRSGWGGGGEVHGVSTGVQGE